MIEAKELVKEFYIQKQGHGLKGFLHPQVDVLRAVDGISFHIEDGEMVGFIGPNGAGKSTTMKMLTSILTPTSGSVMVNQFVPTEDRKHYVASIGAMFGQKTQLWWDLPLEDSFLLLKDMYKISDRDYAYNMKLFCEVLDLEPLVKQPVRQLSLGQRIRGDLAAVFLHNPKVVFLDEPTLGLDFLVKKRIREFIRQINELRHTTVLLTSHDIADIEALCDRLIIIHHGKIIYDGSLETLRKNYGQVRKLIITTAAECEDWELEGARLLSSESNRKIYVFDSHVSPSDLIMQAGANHAITDISIKEPEIEDIISTIYEMRGL